MPNARPKIVIVCGPTASGKSDAAIQLAKKFDGEIISADSRQIYRGMDIGTGKVTRDSRVESRKLKVESGKKAYVSEGVLHHLIDVADPNEDFNISHFKTLANKAIEEILSHGKLPIICGGTGFWIDAITNDTMIPEVAPNVELRNMLRSKTATELFEQLQKLDPERAKTIDKQNPVRLIRAIEICKALGKVPKLQNTTDKIQDTRYDFLQLGISVSREALNEKIKKRLDERFEIPASRRRVGISASRGGGMIEEVQSLNNSPAGEGVSWERLEALGLEYRWIARFLQNKISLEEMKEKLYFDIIHYAKRQMTWFKRNKNIVWCRNYNEIENKVIEFLK